MLNPCPVLCCAVSSECCSCFPAAVGFLAVSSVVTMSAPFFLGKIIDVIYTDPSGDFGDSLTRLCAGLTCVFLCGAAANAVRVYLMQSSGQFIRRGSSQRRQTEGLGWYQGFECHSSRPQSLPDTAFAGDRPHIPPRWRTFSTFVWSGLSR